MTARLPDAVQPVRVACGCGGFGCGRLVAEAPRPWGHRIFVATKLAFVGMFRVAATAILLVLASCGSDKQDRTNDVTECAASHLLERTTGSTIAGACD